jgi:hypothetical protein
VTVGVEVDPPQAARKITRTNKLKKRSVAWRKDMVFLPETRFMKAIIQQTVCVGRPFFSAYLTALIKSASKPYAVVCGPGLPSTILRLDKVSV